MDEQEPFRAWLEDTVSRGRALPRRSNNHYELAEVSGWRTGVEHLLVELVGSESPYYKRFAETADRDTNAWAPLVESNVAMMEAVMNDFMNRRLRSVRRIVEAAVFSDLLDMAEHILQNGYYGASAALTGGVLERGLQAIATANGIAVGAVGDMPALNSRLAKACVYNTLRQKEIQYYIDIRNKAAHGEYDKSDPEDTHKMIEGVRGFLAAYGS